MKPQLKILFFKIKNFFQNLKSIYKFLILFLIVLILIILFAHFNKQSNLQIQRLEKEISYLSELEKKLKKKNQFLKEKKHETKNIKTKLNTLVSSENLNEKISKLLKNAENSELFVSSYEVKKTKDKNYFETKSIEVNLEGEFFSFINFLKELQSNNGICKLKEFSIARQEEGLLKASLICNFYINKESK